MNRSRTDHRAGLEPAVLSRRLDSVRMALGAERLAVVRRPRGPLGSGPAPLEILGQVGPQGPIEPPERDLPLEFVLALMAGERDLRLTRGDAAPPWDDRLQRWQLAWIEGWALPDDRLPSVYFVALARHAREAGDVRREVARRGMEALARALVPPAWMAVAVGRRQDAGGGDPAVAADARNLSNGFPDGSPLAEVLARVEREMLVRALRAAEGNKTRAARSLRLSRQGLYRKLHRHGLLRAPARALDSGGGGD